MKILIVEDEKPIARYIERMCRQIAGDKIGSIHIIHNLDYAGIYLAEKKIDLCLLDLNLNGKDGYNLLKLAAAESFQTIVISANTDRAIEAFEYGVLDFIAKPFKEERLRDAFKRYFDINEKQDVRLKYLSINKEKQHVVIPVEDAVYFKAAGIYVEMHLLNKRVEILEKTMNRLEQILPQNFIRVHRSYLVNLNKVHSYGHCGGGNYRINLQDGIEIPVSRLKYKELQEKFEGRIK